MRAAAGAWGAAGALAVALAAPSAAHAAEAAPPTLQNARLETRPATGGLGEAVRGLVAAAAGPLWIAYDVPGEGALHMCCWESVQSVASTRAPGCRLEGRGVTSGNAGGGAGTGPVQLEDDHRAVIFLRAEAGRLTRVRTLSWQCGVDAGGTRVVWLSGVRPADSAALLATLLREDGGRGLLDEALLALSVHADAAALDRMVEAARGGQPARVRSQALFWLSQKAGRRATEAIATAVNEDPESQVRQQAVFALSQLPAQEGVPKLIELARAHRDPHVRERAMFWLGQSEDPRALAFFEQVLRN